MNPLPAPGHPRWAGYLRVRCEVPKQSLDPKGHTCNSDAMQPQPLISPPAAARRVGVSGETVRRWCASGHLRHTLTPTGRILIAPADVDALMVAVDQVTS